ncbi:O-antigen ligase family protein [Acidicapsa ligni]|uniref:O-antigen ligase family protein n=1 Tax=Acidicapsa ligni TaxID=542300 RepID=UPI0021DFC15F|nr:O-antigen ligase family protein [Acidicapsa ligni]
MISANHIPQAKADAGSKSSFRTPLQLLAGFFFAYRFALIYLGFQSDPRAGSITTLACSALILTASILYTVGDENFSIRFLFTGRTVWWLLAYLGMSGLSLLWTGAESIMDAGGLWTGMVMEVATVLLIVKRPNVAVGVDALLKGFVLGMLFVGAVAWMGPTLPDLRIGDYDFLHPNIIGMYSALAFFLAQHLALEERMWRWACLALGITMLRSISKTSIIAFFIAESFYLLRDKHIRRRVKIQIAAVALIVFAVFATLMESYLEIYTTSGGVNQAETLTGRTAIWATAFFMAIEKPLLGHGFYSFRALIPAFGSFEPWHAHNELLQEFFEYGLLGVVVTIGIYLSLISAAKRFTAKMLVAASNTSRPYGKLATVVILFAIIHGLTESVNFGLSIPLWLFAALAIVLEQSSSKAGTS